MSAPRGTGDSRAAGLAGKLLAVPSLSLVLLAAGCGDAAGDRGGPADGTARAGAPAVDPSIPPDPLPSEPFPQSYRDFPKQPAGTLTFARDIAPLIYEHCGGCHRPGGAAPFPLLGYEEVRKRTTEIATVTKLRFMPPWLPERDHAEFVGERGLGVEQVGKLQQWIFEGAPEGDPADLPPMPEWPEGWELGEPDLVVRLDETYTLPAGGSDVFRNFVIPARVGEDRHVRGYEFRPDNPRVIHHASVEIDRTRASRRRDAEDPEPGYAGMQTDTTSPPDGHFIGWVPGRRPTLTPESMSWRLGRDTDLVVQLHMIPSGKPEPVNFRLGLHFSDRPPTEVPQMVRLGPRVFEIPAGEAEFVTEDTYRLPVDVHLHAVVPHAHYLGKDLKGWATLPDGTRRWLIWIPDWDFNWQDEYRYVEPVFLPSGTVLAMRFTFDNSASNERNPHDPPIAVPFGPNTTDEMGDMWYQVLATNDRDAELLRAHVALANLERSAVEARALIAREPTDPAHYDRLGNKLMLIGRPDQAAESFRRAVELDPAYPHYRRNLGTAMFHLGRAAEAVEHLRKVIELDPRDAEGHTQLGFILSSQGDLEGGVVHLRRAVELRPDHPRSRFHLARALELSDRPREALAEYRRTAEQEPSWTPPLNAAAWLAATNPAVLDPPAAVRDAERAAELGGRADPAVLEALGVAYAAASRFGDAVQAAERALLLSSGPGQEGRRQRLQDALRHYRSGVPYRPPRPSAGP